MLQEMPFDRQTDVQSYLPMKEKALSNWVIACRFLRKKNSILGGLEKNLVKRNQERSEAISIKQTIDVSEIDKDSISVKELGKLLRAQKKPYHIPGFAKNCNAVKNWSTDFFAENYGDDVMPCVEGYIHEDMNLRDLVSMMKRGSKEKQKYLQAVADVFCRHKELLKDLPMKEIFALQKSGFHGVEMFMGAKGTGSPWHCANEWTFFINVRGQKKWEFIRPEFTLHMKPFYQRELIHVGSAYWNDAPPGITRYQVTLNPGDMLVFPGWWWHRVENITDETLACAVRFRTIKQQFKSANPLLSILQLTTLQQWKNILFERFTGQFKDDERYLRRAMDVIV